MCVCGEGKKLPVLSACVLFGMEKNAQIDSAARKTRFFTRNLTETV